MYLKLKLNSTEFEKKKSKHFPVAQTYLPNYAVLYLNKIFLQDPSNKK